MTIVLQIPAGAPPPDPELAAREHEAALVAQARNAGIAECQRFLRDTAQLLDVSLSRAGLPTIMASAYQSAAELLEALRS